MLHAPHPTPRAPCSIPYHTKTHTPYIIPHTPLTAPSSLTRLFLRPCTRRLWRHDPARDPDATDPRDPAAIEHFDWLLYVATNIAQWEAAQPNFKSPFRRTDDIPAPDRTILHEVWPTVPLKLSKRDDALLAEQLRRGLLFTTYDPRIYTFLNEARIEQYLIREEEQNRRRAAAASDLQGRVESSSDSGASDGDSAEANQQ